MNQKAPHRALLSVKKVAERLSIAEKSIYNRICRGAKDPFPIKVKRFMGKPLFDSRDVEAFIESLPYESDYTDIDALHGPSSGFDENT